MRYNTAKIKKLQGGVKTLTTTLYPRIKERSSDTFLIVVEKTRLDHLAHKFYENASYWWVIGIANSIKGTLHVTPGTQIRIPREIGGILQDFNKINKR
jgi:nucleoid-associated protein YgaU